MPIFAGEKIRWVQVIQKYNFFGVITQITSSIQSNFILGCITPHTWTELLRAAGQMQHHFLSPRSIHFKMKMPVDNLHVVYLAS